MQLIADRGGGTSTGLRGVLQVLQKWRRQVGLLPGENCFLPRLVEVEFLRINREAALDGAIEEVRLGEPEYEVALAVADAGLHGESFAQAEKIVRAVADAHEGPGQTADAS